MIDSSVVPGVFIRAFIEPQSVIVARGFTAGAIAYFYVMAVRPPLPSVSTFTCVISELKGRSCVGFVRTVFSKRGYRPLSTRSCISAVSASLATFLIQSVTDAACIRPPLLSFHRARSISHVGSGLAYSRHSSNFSGFCADRSRGISPPTTS